MTARQLAASIEWMIVQRPKRTFKSPCKNCLDCVKQRTKYQLSASAKMVRKLEQKYEAIDGTASNGGLFTTLRKVVNFTQKKR